MATLRKTEFFHLEITGKVRMYYGCCLEISFLCINKNVIDEIPLDMKM